MKLLVKYEIKFEKLLLKFIDVFSFKKEFIFCLKKFEKVLKT